MAGKLTVRQVETLKEPGRHADGGNLYLSISKTGAKSWVLFYRFKSKRREMGLGSASPGQVSLADARRKAAEARKQLLEGIDPLAEKGVLRRWQSAMPTFGDFADDYLKLHLPKFRNEKHRGQWTMTLREYCGPIRSLPVNLVDTEAVLSVLKPIWQQIPDSASRIRGRIENILDAARAQGLIKGENPARWKGHLNAILPARQRLSQGHHAALHYDDLPTFLGGLRTRQSMAALALEFCILTATRTSETLQANWDEIDFDKAIWTIPRARMKAGKEHRVPLTARALKILKPLRETKPSHNEFVFPGQSRGAPLSQMAMTMQLRRMKRTDITVHGFRSTFRDWTSEQTSFPHETCEHALAHRISDKAEAAYRRGDQFDKRRKLMEAWEQFCVQQPKANVVPLRKSK